MAFRFAHPLALFLLLIPPLVLAVRWRKNWRTLPPLLRYSDTRLMAGLPAGWRIQLRAVPDVLRLGAWVLLALALARPQSGDAKEIVRGQGIDIALALDISGSMGTEDFAPDNRLQAAKTVIRNFIAGREFDRIGLVVFARDAFYQSPPTLDYKLLVQLLDEVKLAPELHIEDGTAIGEGLAAAANMLRSSTAPSRIIILLTDGTEEGGSIAPTTAAEAVGALGIRVYTVGMGQPDAIDQRTLQEIADITGGEYYQAQDTQGLQRTYDTINNLEKSDVERQLYIRWQDNSAVLLVIALLFLIIERMLRHSVFQTIP